MANRQISSGKQWQTVSRQRSRPRYQPHNTPAGNPRRLQPHEWPPRWHLENIMGLISDQLIKECPKRTIEAEYPPQVPAGEEFDSLRDTAAAFLYEEDVTLARQGPGPRQVKNVLKALNVGHMMAYRRKPMMQFYTQQEKLVYSDEEPWNTTPKGGELAVWEPRAQPVLIVAKHHECTDPITRPDGQKAFLVVRAYHNNKCRCSDTYANNNLECLLYGSICLPKQMTPQYESLYFPAVQDSHTEKPTLLNRSMLYFSYVSKLGTITPSLMNRQSLAQLQLGPARPRRAPFSQTDLIGDRLLLSALAAQINRPDYALFTAYMSEDGGETDLDGRQFRFASIEKQKLSIDLTEREKNFPVSTDDVLNNSIFVTPWHGRSACSFCSEQVELNGIHTAVSHLMSKHKNLARAFFTCPTCLLVSVHTWDSFLEHWEEYHQPTSALLVTLEESHISQRMCWGMALCSAIAACDTLDIELFPEKDEEEWIVSALGGFTLKSAPNADPIVLGSKVEAERFALLPPEVATAVTKREHERYQEEAKRREEKRKRNTNSTESAQYSAPGEKPKKVAFEPREMVVSRSSSNRPPAKIPRSEKMETDDQNGSHTTRPTNTAHDVAAELNRPPSPLLQAETVPQLTGFPPLQPCSNPGYFTAKTVTSDHRPPADTPEESGAQNRHQGSDNGPDIEILDDQQPGPSGTSQQNRGNKSGSKRDPRKKGKIKRAPSSDMEED